MVLGLLFELNLLCHCRDLQGKSRPCFCSPIHGKRRLWIVVGPRPSSEHLHLGSNSGDMDRQYERRLVEDPWIDTWGQGSAGTCWRHKVLHPSCCTCSSAINRECNEWLSPPHTLLGVFSLNGKSRVSFAASAGLLELYLMKFLKERKWWTSLDFPLSGYL